ncbi:hypothetical protein [Achromobacter sp. SLBN-14]|uniref:hypothetical protein n=1 Tax=Achromobacter sp. SLBN-14 TaxID=2768442 RepID=UPI0011547B1B|nr:hypothetical protein [Achromobacter sp. SLBN-14]TQJ97290.1 hypothetical protein FBY20_4085 [Achromobacter sp. SLBN-14]
MNTVSASASPVRPRLPITIKQAARKLGALIAPRDHAGKGNWNDDADIPLWAWPASLALAAFFLFGPQLLGWMLRIIV